MPAAVRWLDGDNPARLCFRVPAPTRNTIAKRVLRAGLERVDELTLLVWPDLQDGYGTAWHGFPDFEPFRALVLARLPGGELLNCMLGLHEDAVRQEAPLVLSASVGPYLAFDEAAVRDALTRYFEEIYRDLRVGETTADLQHDASLTDALRKPRS